MAKKRLTDAEMSALEAGSSPAKKRLTDAEMAALEAQPAQERSKSFGDYAKEAVAGTREALPLAGSVAGGLAGAAKGAALGLPLAGPFGAIAGGLVGGTAGAMAGGAGGELLRIGAEALPESAGGLGQAPEARQALERVSRQGVDAGFGEVIGQAMPGIGKAVSSAGKAISAQTASKLAKASPETWRFLLDHGKRLGQISGNLKQAAVDTGQKARQELLDLASKSITETGQARNRLVEEFGQKVLPTDEMISGARNYSKTLEKPRYLARALKSYQREVPLYTPVEVVPPKMAPIQEEILATPVSFRPNPLSESMPWLPERAAPPLLVRGETQPIQREVLAMTKGAIQKAGKPVTEMRNEQTVAELVNRYKRLDDMLARSQKGFKSTATAAKQAVTGQIQREKGQIQSQLKELSPDYAAQMRRFSEYAPKEAELSKFISQDKQGPQRASRYALSWDKTLPTEQRAAEELLSPQTVRDLQGIAASKDLLRAQKSRDQSIPWNLGRLALTGLGIYGSGETQNPLWALGAIGASAATSPYLARQGLRAQGALSGSMERLLADPAISRIVAQMPEYSPWLESKD